MGWFVVLAVASAPYWRNESGAVMARSDMDARQTLSAAWPSALRERLRIVTMRANGGRPVAVFVAPGFDANRSAHLVTYLHGHNSDVGPSIAANGVLGRLALLAEADPQSIFVLPQAARPPFDYWMRAPESFAAVEREALLIAAEVVGSGQISVESRNVNAHSGGGAALANAIAEGELVADKVNLLDCAYRDWGILVVNWAIAQSRVGRRVAVESWYTRHLEMTLRHKQMVAAARGAGLLELLRIHDVTNKPDPRYMRSRERGLRDRRIEHRTIPANFLGT